MYEARIVLNSRREFINASHMLAHGVNFRAKDTITWEIVGGFRVKKSLAADAFLKALMHTKGVFHVPQDNKMMFERYESDANDGIALGVVHHKEMVIDVAFGRESYGQKWFLNNTQAPSLLIVPREKNFNGDGYGPDIRLEIDDLGDDVDDFCYSWKVEVLSRGLQNRQTVQDCLQRFSDISKRRNPRLFQVF